MNLKTLLNGLSSYLMQRSNPKAMGLLVCRESEMEVLVGL